MDIYIHRIGRTCRDVTNSSSIQGVAITLFTSHDTGFATQLVKYFQTHQQPVPSSLRILATGIPEKIHQQGVGLGFKNQTTENQMDAFAGYYQNLSTNSSEGVVIETGSSQYKTLYDQQTNTYTTVPLTISAQQPIQSSQVLNGFVNSQISQPQDSLPVSSYGGPDDEWDSSKMALESALAAIRARRGAVESERLSNRHRSNSHLDHQENHLLRHHSRSRSYRHHSRSQSHQRHSRSRSHQHHSRSRSHRHHSRDHDRRNHSRTHSHGYRH